MSRRYPRRWQEKRERSRTGQSGRFSLVFSPFWRDPDVKTLTRDERDLLLCLRTGSSSNQAGIFLLNLDAIIRDFESFGDRPSRDEIMAHLAGLAKKPRPTRPFIMFDEDVLWICSHLAEERQEPSENHVKGIRFELSCLPRHSKVVRAFCREYADLLDAGPTTGPEAGPEVAPVSSPHPQQRSSPSTLNPHSRERERTPTERGGSAGGGGSARDARPPSDPPGVQTDFQSPSERNTSNGVGTAASNDEARAKVLQNVVAMLRDQNPNLPQATYWREAERLVKEQREKWAGASWPDIFKAVIHEVQP